MTQERLKELIKYDKDTGEMRKLVFRKNNSAIKAGIRIRLDGKTYSCLKLAWLYVEGVYPKEHIFTKDGTDCMVFSNLGLDNMFNGKRLTQSILKSYCTYDKNTGNLIFVKRWSKSTQIGSIAGSIVGTLPNEGYRVMHFGGTNYPVHRVVWLYHYGTLPEKQIDHLNHNRVDNRIENLRETSHHTNMKNKSLYVTNQSGYPGVAYKDEVWISRISIDGNKIHLGSFITFEEAVAARKAGEKILNYHTNHGIHNYTKI